jgi:5-methylcytosine-specific restriction endonuclease McrA
MDESRSNTPTPAQLKEVLRQLRATRRARQVARDKTLGGRKALTPKGRQQVFAKTAGRCHICGGVVEFNEFQADHVFAHSAGGTHAADNYLPAHRLCNNYRWDYSAEEFQWVLKIGVWTRFHMEKGTPLAEELLLRFCKYEEQREGRKTTG